MAIIIARTFIVYAALLVTMRLLGKRQLGEMELSEFIVAALAADLAGIPLQDIGIPLLNGLVPILILFCCEVLVAGASMKSVRLRAFLFGKPGIVIDHGSIVQSELRKNRLTLDELSQGLRASGCTDIGKIEYAVLETDGTLSILPYPAERPLTAGDLGTAVRDTGYVSMIVNDGRLMEENLLRLGHDREWLARELSRRGIASTEDVFLMTLNAAGDIHLELMEDRK